MKTFAKPAVGSVVTITTRYPDYYYYRTSDWRETTYENVTVLNPERWVKPNQIQVTSDLRRIPFRVIDMERICDLKLSSGELNDLPTNAKSFTVKVKGSKNNEYIVTIKDGVAVSCTCPHHMFRHASCKHMASVETS